MAALFDFTKEALDDVVGANKFPMFFGELVEGQTGGQIAAQTIHGGGINPFIFDHEGCRSLFGFFAVVLVEDRLEFGIDLVLLFLGDVAQDILHFVLDTALAFGGGELVLDGVDHGFTTIGDPQINLLDTAVFQVIHQILPRFLVFTIADAEPQDLPFSGTIDPDDG